MSNSRKSRASHDVHDSSGLHEWHVEMRAKSVERRNTLLELANLSDRDAARFWHRRSGLYEEELKGSCGVLPSDRDAIYKYRDNLRKIWRDHELAGSSVDSWVQEANERRPWVVLRHSKGGGTEIIRSVLVLPNYSILPLSLALGVSEFLPQMAVCENPQCPNPYFLKGRRTQRFCDRPACAAYGQRQHKLMWWKENGDRWKRKWLRRSKKRKK